jgi:hypothetical protein
MFTLECLHEHVPVFLELVRQRNSGLLDQLTVIDHEYHSEVSWDVPDGVLESVCRFQSIDMNDTLIKLRYSPVYSLRVRLINNSALIHECATYLEQNLKMTPYGGKFARNVPPFNWKEQQELNRIKLLLDITG